MIGFLVVLGLLFGPHFLLESSKRQDAVKKYGKGEVSQAIIDCRIFEGMSQWQLLESWGRPAAKETTVLKSKTKETWMYGRLNRVFLENGYVVGWKQRGR